MEKKRDAQRKQEREEASHYCEITVDNYNYYYGMIGIDWINVLF